MKSRDEVRSENRKNFIKKGVKSQGQFSKSSTIQTIEDGAINDSIKEAKENQHEF